MKYSPNIDTNSLQSALSDALDAKRHGDKKLWFELVAVCYDFMVKVALKKHYARNTDDAQEIAQNICVRLFEGQLNIPGDAGKFLGYLTSAVYKESFTLYRRRESLPQGEYMYVEDKKSREPVDILIQQENLQFFQAALDRARLQSSDDNWRAFKEVILNGQEQQTYARNIGKHSGNVCRGIAKVKRCIADEISNAEGVIR